ncbi:hypothetical protein [Metaclostridioides mangenotii]|uniref:hypothetical protein n=1 Tax=Metaclostridioides mangenotii TaxID=1540 RepID=UPI0028F108D2|nr:hypothetical protein [Clostridioides mangenotii]
MNKKAKKFISLTMASFLIATTFVTNSFAIGADEHEQVNIYEEQIYMDSEYEDNIPIGTEISFTDEELEILLREQGVSEDILKIYHQSEDKRMYRSAKAATKKNKIVKVKNGYDIYLTKKTIDVLRTGGTTAVVGVITLYLPGLGRVVVNSIAAMINKALPGAKTGKIFRDKITRE